MLELDQLTVGEVKQLISLFGNGQGLSQPKESTILNDVIGKYVICRTRNEGINCGKVLQADDTGVVLECARRIYYHKPKDSSVSWYEGVATTGLHSDSKISGETPKKYIIEDYSLTLCTDVAEKSLRNHESTGS